MNNFLDRFKPKANALQNALNQNLPGQKFKGSGQSLGGGDSHFKVLAMQLNEQGPLGMGVEKMKSGGCVVSHVEPSSQAEQAGILRGDVVCFAGSNGKEEVEYGMFLQLAKAKDRPICFEVRRAKASSTQASQQQQQQQSSSSTGGGGGWLGIGGGTSNSNKGGGQSAEAYARKQAMIAAAEAREKANKAKLKPISRGAGSNISTTTSSSKDTTTTNTNNAADELPKTEAARAAIEAAKVQETITAQQLGYNPYEPNRATAGQARNATVAMTHGTIAAATAPASSSAQGGGTSSSGRSTSTTNASPPSPNAVRPPRNVLLPEGDDGSVIDPEFDHALQVMVSNNSDNYKASLTIIRKLIVNATTKGQAPGEDSAKFRRVRLANPKIAAAVVEPPGAIDLLLSTGFTLTHEDETGESVLVYPVTTTPPAWLPAALKRLQACEQ